MLFIKDILYTIFIAGSVTIFAPAWLLLRNLTIMPSPWQVPQYLALAPAATGGAIFLRCLWDFASRGSGTPSFFDPPRALVVHGLYRYVRNPLYLGYLLVLLGEAAFFESWALLRYAAGFFATAHLIVVFYEEPHLSRRFGESYNRYRKGVRRWVPVKDAFAGEE
ncbi:MAG TPA: methyltransferase [Nitrospirota bacterium]